MNNLHEDNNIISDPTPPKNSIKNETKELIRFILIAAIIIIPFRIFIAQPFVVNGASMDPTFETNQYLIVEQLSYHKHQPERGDVIVFRYPNDPSNFYIKRVIGLPGETITFQGNNIYIKEVDSNQSYKIDEPYITFKSNNTISPITIDEGEYFVMGDNRPNSSDSRTWGTLPEKFIIGKAFLRLLPLNKIELNPGEHFIQITDQAL